MNSILSVVPIEYYLGLSVILFTIGVMGVLYWPDDRCRGLVFSNLHDDATNLGVNHVRGERYTSVTDAIFRDNNSGISKIAALSATIMNRSCSVRAEKRPRAFHLFVPLWSA